jgi:HAD superfamily hydrolase (TIGR01509 family)
MDGNRASAPGFEELFRAAELLIFDFDGVLADSEPWFRRSWNHALSLWSHVIPERDYWLYWSSLGQGLEGEVLRNGLQGIEPDLARARQKQAYEGYCRDGLIPLFPGVRELLERLSGRDGDGRRFCIASNTGSDLVRTVLLRAGAPVPIIVGGENLRPKPHPDIFLRVADLLSVPPCRTLVFEDSQKGASAAMQGGFPFVLVRNPCNTDLDIPHEHCLEGIGGLLQVLEAQQTAV